MQCTLNRNFLHHEIITEFFEKKLPELLNDMEDLAKSSADLLNKDESVVDVFPAIRWATITIGDKDYNVKIEIDIND